MIKFFDSAPYQWHEKLQEFEDADLWKKN